jgi:anti-sigma factor (TIGR02949 family)
MNCPKARFLLYAYLERELSRADADALQRHLGQCGSCSERARSARHLTRLLRTRLEYARAPIRLRERLSSGIDHRPIRMRYAPIGIAASILLMILPLVADQRGPRQAAMSLAGSVAVAAPSRVIPQSRQMTGTFVCLHCEAIHTDKACPVEEPAVHELGFCADNGETWRVMTTDSSFKSASVGQTVTVEGVAFPESGFLRASRVGY